METADYQEGKKNTEKFYLYSINNFISRISSFKYRKLLKNIIL